jgi:hypothetical protein
MKVPAPKTGVEYTQKPKTIFSKVSNLFWGDGSAESQTDAKDSASTEKAAADATGPEESVEE